MTVLSDKGKVGYEGDESTSIHGMAAERTG